jgi:hypothetical protein
MALVVLIAAYVWWSDQTRVSSPTGFHAVFLDNNLVVIGKLEGMGRRFPVLREVYYMRPSTNPETKQTVNVLVKRGNELHGPDLTVINREHILFVEPVATGSRMDKLIQEVKMRGGAPATAAP